MSAKSEEVRKLIQKHHDDSGFWGNDGTGFQGNQAKESLQKLDGLNAEDFKAVMDGLSAKTRKRLATDARKHDLDDEDKPYYRDLLAALDKDIVTSEDIKKFFDAKQYLADQKAAVEFNPDYGYLYNPLNQGDHLRKVQFYRPKGASEMLKALIRETEFVMQLGFDTFGTRNPEAAPDFDDVLDGPQLTTVEGWSQVKRKYTDVNAEMEGRQKKYRDEHTTIKIATEEFDMDEQQVYQDLDFITKELEAHLLVKLPDGVHQGGKITDGVSGATMFERNHDEKATNFGKYELTDATEHAYYIKHIDTCAEKWKSTYKDGTKQYQKKAADIDGDDGGLKKPPKDGDDGGNKDGGNNTGANNTGANNTGANNTGGNNTGGNNTGANNTGGNNTGANNTGANNTGVKPVDFSDTIKEDLATAGDKETDDPLTQGSDTT
ncbi:hypothetical protein ACLMAL_39450, partial [Nocardia sp. CWNU-33]